MSESSPEYSRQPRPDHWTLGDGRKIRLIRPEVLEELSVGTELIRRNGSVAILGEDPIEMDTETFSGLLPYGLPSLREDRRA